MAPLVLVVDDDPDILEAVCDVLAGEGYRVARARHGREALARVAEERPDLVLLDMMMPVMDGLAFARELQAAGRSPPIPVVVISADGDAERAGGVGAREFLPKPFDLDALLDAVRRSAGPAESHGASHP
jgi:CheY-like chemotaxis protein